MLRRAAHRRHQRVLAVVLDAHQRELTDLGGLVAPGRHDDDRQSPVEQRVGLGPTRAFIGLDLIAHPLRRTRFVFTCQRHVRNATGRAAREKPGRGTSRPRLPLGERGGDSVHDRWTRPCATRSSGVSGGESNAAPVCTAATLRWPYAVDLDDGRACSPRRTRSRRRTSSRPRRRVSRGCAPPTRSRSPTCSRSPTNRRITSCSNGSRKAGLHR